MAIQPVVLGEPVTGEGGDNYREAHTKINANFVEIKADITSFNATIAGLDDALNNINGEIP